MIPLKITICDSEGLKIAADVLAKAVEYKASIAIWGQVGTGKTTLLRRIIEASKLQKTEIVYIDFDTLINGDKSNPRYVVVDHPTLPDSLERARQKYPGVPLLAVLYKEPEGGFDIVVEMNIQPFLDPQKRRFILLPFEVLCKGIEEGSVVVVDPK